MLPIDLLSYPTHDELNAAIMTLKSKAECRAALGRLYRQFPPAMWRSGMNNPGDNVKTFSMRTSDPVDFPIFNEGPIMFSGRVLAPAPTGYDPTLPTIFLLRVLTLEAFFIVGQVEGYMDALPETATA